MYVLVTIQIVLYQPRILIPGRPESFGFIKSLCFLQVLILSLLLKIQPDKIPMTSLALLCQTWESFYFCFFGCVEACGMLDW